MHATDSLTSKQNLMLKFEWIWLLFKFNIFKSIIQVNRVSLKSCICVIEPSSFCWEKTKSWLNSESSKISTLDS